MYFIELVDNLVKKGLILMFDYCLKVDEDRKKMSNDWCMLCYIYNGIFVLLFGFSFV